MAKVYIRDREWDGAAVHEIEVGRPNAKNFARFLAGLLRNLNVERYWVDDCEVECRPSAAGGRNG